MIAENINDNQYSIDDFTNIVGEIDKSLVSIDSTSSKDKYDFKVSKDAQPPFDKFHAMLENVPGFKETWEHKRKDMADDSQSGYDLSLATFMAKSGANFTEQEMVNTLIKNRMKFGNHIDKIKRKRYYARTIKKARQAVETEKIHDRLDDYKLLTSEERKKERGKIRNELSKALGVKIDRIIKYKFGESGEKSEYLIHSNDEIISLPDVTYLIHQRKFDKIVADMLGYRMKHIKSKRWRDISQYLLDVCYLIDLGEAGTTYGMVVDNFEKYLETWGCPVKDDEINKEALYMKMREKEPFIDDDWLYIHFTHYLTHLNRTTSIRKKASDIVKIFKRLGFEKKQVRYKSNQNWETRRYWKIRYNNIRRLVKNHEN
ncbi:hypothetical protein AKJ51_04625 [candidate division MSBL1 archaeon SCGC-AAA382A20]|uniref:Uncharacterized protein n=1 Tax=candidate division MSBL1 archaeon SCGC-AAA382A20 TaxID=1698280 RepID=A0A133VHE4_9EURY|nr:hypothetical protein AKJ51_04625 [candidate division MSBL1 archaeon SCGC-AAA382A20]